MALPPNHEACLRPLLELLSDGEVHQLADVREDLAAEQPRFRAIREKHGMAMLNDDEHLRALTAEGRVLLAITPPGPPSSWTSWGLD